MTFSGDPYRTLGLAPDASLDDVKRAYRRLAKQYHPDAAGPEAVARFLAIQGAYEALAGSVGRRGGGRGPGRPSQADAARARATRDAYRSRHATGWGGTGRGSAGDPDPWRSAWRSGGSSAGTSGSPPDGRTDAPGSAAGRGGTRGAREAGGQGDTGERAGTGAPKGRRRDPSSGSRRRETGRTDAGDPREGERRPDRKATLSSTSYDDAAQEPRHPDWQGSSWYGTSSGTYWTINPREYADPRKHGPEYQARARRAADGRDPGRPEHGPAPSRQPPSGGSGRREGEGGSAPFGGASGAGGATWSDAGPGMPRAPHGRDEDVAPGAPGDTARRDQARATDEGAPASRIPSASSVGLVTGVVVAVPAFVVLLASMMAGDLTLAAVALVVPAVVALAVGVVLAVVRRRA